MHYALICPEMTGHLNPMTTLGNALQRRGHRVSLLGTPAQQRLCESRGLDFLPIGEAEQAAGTFSAERQKLGRLRGFSALRFTGEILCHWSAIVQRDAPAVLDNAGVNAVVWDQVTPGGESVAELLGLPHAMACNALAIHSETAIPPAVTGWRYGTGRLRQLRNRLGNSLIRFAGRPMANAVNRFRRDNGIRRLWHPTVQDGGKIQVAQQPRFFDFPNRELPSHFHYTGPWHAPHRDRDESFPWERLDGRPVVYASLGTLQNRQQHLFAAIVRACRDLNVQLVLSLGGSDVKIDETPASGAIVVPYAPQLELLKIAKAVVTHAGLNTALETLACGIPMVAIPITNDQPGVARRLQRLGVAEYVAPRSATAPRIERGLHRILTDAAFRTEADFCRERCQASPDAHASAELIDRALCPQERDTFNEAVRVRGAIHRRWVAGGDGPPLMGPGLSLGRIAAGCYDSQTTLCNPARRSSR